MNDYKIIATSAEVWAVIFARHHDHLKVFSSFSNPQGTFNGGAGLVGEIFTAYGLEGADYPIMQAETTWDINKEEPYIRNNEKTKYWLCIPIKEKE